MNENIARYRLRSVTYERFRPFRSLTIRFGDITLLAGPNGSGKSSAMRPLLLIKQSGLLTSSWGLQASGPNVVMQETDHVCWEKRQSSKIILKTEEGLVGVLIFRPEKDGQSLFFDIVETQWEYDGCMITLRRRMTQDEKQRVIRNIAEAINKWSARNIPVSGLPHVSLPLDTDDDLELLLPWIILDEIAQRIIHVSLPRLLLSAYRYSPPKPPHFSGLFQHCTASLLFWWQEQNSPELNKLGQMLQQLEIAQGVEARMQTEEVEIHVTVHPNLPPVNVANVNPGVSLVLPVLVSLLVAQPGQMVYIEHPEAGLHPGAQVKLADFLVETARRGVQVVVETHSELILLGIQKAVAEGRIKADRTMLHWFERRDTGETHVYTAQLDEDGTFGDWPVDFSDVALDAMGKYLDAASMHAKKKHESGG